MIRGHFSELFHYWIYHEMSLLKQTGYHVSPDFVVMFFGFGVLGVMGFNFEADQNYLRITTL